MTVLIDEVGSIASDSIETILRSDSSQPWKKLVDGGWAGLAADPEADLSLRALQEIARITGRYAVATSLLPTLLAGRWFDPTLQAQSSGIGIALAGDEGAVVPYATDEMVVLGGDGREVPRADVGPVSSDFSAVMPLALLDGGGDVGGLSTDHLAELHAVLSAVAVGCGDAVLDRAAQWSQTRTQFGQPIRNFQAVRHHLANMHICREQAWTAAIACANEHAEAPTWSRQACALALDTIETGIQVHGGVGFTWEVGLQNFLCHVLQIRSVLGAAA